MIRWLLVPLCLLAGCAESDPGEPTAEARAASARGPASVVEAYYTAISNRDYDTAWQLWGKDPAANPEEFAEFTEGFADTELAIAEVGVPGEEREVGGFHFVEIPVRIEDLKSDGTGSSYTGTYTLRRTTDDDESWHILRGDLGG